MDSAASSEDNPLLRAMADRAKTLASAKPAATKRSTLALREGVAAVEFPALLSAESKVRLGKWLEMMVEFADVLPENSGIR